MTGIILLNLGGPDSLDAVKPFLYNLFSDRDIIRLGPAFLQKPLASLIVNLRAKKARGLYGLIGGKSPLEEITVAQAAALQKKLGARLPVYVGMRYWKPFISDTVEQMHKDGIKRILALSLYPHYSIATTGSSLKAFKEAAAKYPLEYVCTGSWFDHPGYLDSLEEKIREGMAKFDEKPAILFSAHSLPQKFIEAGDPYAKEIMGTIEALEGRIDMQWHLSYQSKTGPVKWLEPSTEHMLHELADKGVKNLLVVPISFVSDHIETLYEIDMLYKEMAQGLGMRIERIESLNTSPKFIEALADIAVKGINLLNKERCQCPDTISS